MQIMQIIEINTTMNTHLAFVPTILSTTHLPLEAHENHMRFLEQALGL